MAIICVYKIVAPNGKIYIGQTIDYKRRVSSYKRGHCKNQILLNRSFLKYGYNNHTFSILKECKEDDLNELEFHFVNIFNTVNNGLNCRPGGNRRGPLSNETKKRFSQAKCGINNPNYNKSTWNKGIKQWNNNHPFLGKKLSPEHIKKIKENNPLIYAKGAENLRAVKINQYSKDMILIKKWGSSQCIMRSLNIDSSSVIKCCRGKLKTTKGFIFRYANNS